jgi:thiol-disulfide isomerase/thioredoxin
MRQGLSTVLRWTSRVAIVPAVLYAFTCGVVLAIMYQSPRVIAPFLKGVPDYLWPVLPMETMWAFANRGKLAPGDLAPDFELLTLDGSSRVKLSSLRGRPVVLFFGSYTCPPFRRQMPDMNRLYEPYKDRAHFYFVYVEEAHATDGWQSKTNKEDGILLANARERQDRVAAGTSCVSHLKIPFPMLVDDMDNRVETAYRAWPTRVYIIDKDGKVAFKTPIGPFGFESKILEPALLKALGPTGKSST